MSGSKEGSKKAMETIKKKYGVDEDGKSLLHQRIGAKGGKSSVTGGFYADRERARSAGSLGGKRSKRGKSLYKITDKEAIYIDDVTGMAEEVDARGMQG